jgi:hypothetical protein
VHCSPSTSFINQACRQMRGRGKHPVILQSSTVAKFPTIQSLPNTQSCEARGRAILSGRALSASVSTDFNSLTRSRQHARLVDCTASCIASAACAREKSPSDGASGDQHIYLRCRERQRPCVLFDSILPNTTLFSNFITET